MYSWIAGRAVRALIGRLNAGDVPALMRAYADDALLVFPGNSSFACERLLICSATDQIIMERSASCLMLPFTFSQIAPFAKWPICAAG